MEHRCLFGYFLVSGFVLLADFRLLCFVLWIDGGPQLPVARSTEVLLVTTGDFVW